MKINKQNYEIFFIDYLDNNLSKIKLKELNEFLEKNPELSNELNELKNFNLKDLSEENIVFEEKNILKKNYISEDKEISKEDFENLCVANLENDITKTLKNELKNHINNDVNKKKEFLLFQKIKFIPNKKIIFNGKNELKKIFSYANGRYIFMTISSIAAIFLIFFSLYLDFVRNEKINNLMVFEKIPCKNITFKFPEMKLKKNDVFFQKKILLEIHINEEMEKDTLIEIFAKNENIKNNEEVFIEIHVNEKIEEDSLIEIFVNNENIKNNLFEIVFDDKENKLSNLDSNLMVLNEKKNSNKNNNNDEDLAYFSQKGNYPNPIKKKKNKNEIYNEKTIKNEYSLKEFVSEKILEKLKIDSLNKDKKIVFWKIADNFINGINNLTDSELVLERTKKDNGKISIHFKSSFIEYKRN